MKHAVASRLAKAGIAAPTAAGLLWMADKIRGVLSVRSADFMPHGYCYLWDPHIVWLNVISDGLITLSYYCIPVVLIYFIRKRRDLPFNWIFWMFGGFILACGTTHLVEVWNIWHASYLFAGIVKAITATISVATAILLIPLVPQAVAVPNLIHLQEKNRRLEEQIAKRQRFDAAVADAPLRRWVSGGITLAVFLIVLLGFLSWRSRRSASAESDLVTHTYAVMHGLETALQHVTEAETSARGFALSGNVNLLAHYRASKNIPPQDVQALRGLSADNPRQQQRIDLLDPQIEAALRFAEQMVTNRLQRNTVPTASEVFETEKLLEAVHGTVLAMQAEESALLSQRKGKTVAGRRRTDLITIAGTFAGVIFLVVAGAAIRRETDISSRALTQLSTLNAELEERVEQRTAALASEIAERKNANDALEHSLAISERALKDLADQKFALDQHAIVATTDVQGTITYVNDKFCAISKYSREELLGQNHRILNSSHHSREFFQQMYHTIANGRVWRGDICNRAKDGSIYWVDTTIVPFLKEEDGKPQQYMAIRADITERKRAEEALREQKYALDQHAIVATTDVQGTITYVNDKFCAISKYSREELLGQNHRILNSSHHSREFFQQMYHTIANGRVWRGEICNRAKDGSIYWVDTTIVPFLDAHGKPWQYMAIRADITERKLAEEALREQKYALDQHAIVATTDVQGTITYVNDKFCAISKYSREELLGQNHRILNSGHHPKEFFQQMYHAIANGKVWRGEICNRAKDGSIYWVDTTIVPFLTASGKPRQYMAIRADITERKRAEEVLHESQERFRLLLDGVKDYAIYMLDPEGNVISWNTGAARIKGYLQEEILGKHFSCFYTPEAREANKPSQELEESLSKGRFEEQGLRVRKDGSAFWANVVITPMFDDHGTLRGFSKVARDVTERKRAEQALQESLATSEAALKELADQKFALDEHAIVAVTDVQGTITYVNEKFCDISQYSKDELIGQNHRILNSGHHPKEFFQEMYHMIAKGKVWHGEIKNRAKDGSNYWVDTTIVPTLATDGKPRQYVAIRADITERKRAEVALAEQAEELSRQSKELLRSQQALEAQTLMLQSVLDSMVEGLVAADETGKFVLWNPAATRIVGMGAENVPPGEWNSHYGVYLPDTITPLPDEQNPLARAIQGEVSAAEVFIRNPELEEGVWLEISGGPLKGKDGVPRGGVVAFRDITQRKKDEREIHALNEELEARVEQRTEELAASNLELEAFTYSVSHDLRAPLRHIGGFSRILLEDFGPKMEPEALSHLHRIEDGTRRMGLLVDELLNLARVGRHALKLEATPLNSIVDDVICLLQPEVNGRVVEWRIEQLPSAMCDPVLVKQVFQNLLANALKFSRPRERAIIEISHRQENGQILLLIRDNGVGFSMKYQDKLFGVFQRLHRAEDFEGTGIGLATVKRIVNKHGGRVWANSELDKGATFYFTLGAAKPAGVMPAEMARKGAENKTTMAGA